MTDADSPPPPGPEPAPRPAPRPKRAYTRVPVSLTPQQAADVRKLALGDETGLHYRTRLMVILMRSSGVPVELIARTLDVCPNTVRRAIRHFRPGDPESLRDYHLR